MVVLVIGGVLWFGTNVVWHRIRGIATPCVPVSDLVLQLSDDGAEIVTAELGTFDAKVRSVVTCFGIGDAAIPLEVCLLKCLHHYAGGVSVELDVCHGRLCVLCVL